MTGYFQSLIKAIAVLALFIVAHVNAITPSIEISKQSKCFNMIGVDTQASTLIFFHADWAQSSKLMKIKVDKLHKRYPGVSYKMVDFSTDKSAVLACMAEKSLNINTIPVLLSIKGGRILPGSLQGFRPASDTSKLDVLFKSYSLQ
ncbi:MAG: hypothetical protein ACI93R_003646 [Flavobacteriales bacterium]|jgi:hypothetical protein